MAYGGMVAWVEHYIYKIYFALATIAGTSIRGWRCTYENRRIIIFAGFGARLFAGNIDRLIAHQLKLTETISQQFGVGKHDIEAYFVSSSLLPSNLVFREFFSDINLVSFFKFAFQHLSFMELVGLYHFTIFIFLSFGVIRDFPTV